MDIKTSKFSIQNWKLEDAQELVETRKDSEITKGLMGIANKTYDLARAVQYIITKEKSDQTFVIKVEDHVAGEIGCILGDYSFASVWYWLSREQRGKGIMTEALKMFTEYAFKRHNLPRMHASTLEWNIKSINVLKRAGYEYDKIYHPTTQKEDAIISYIKRNPR